MMEVIEDREMWRLNLKKLCPLKPCGKSGNKEQKQEKEKKKRLKF